MDLTEEVTTLMADPIPSIIVVLVVGGGLALLVWGLFRGTPSITRPFTSSFRCPFRNRDVTAEFTEKAWDGKPVDVRTCSAFDPPTAITCEKLCLRLSKPLAPPQTRRVA